MFLSGQYLVDAVNSRTDMELAFVWNRSIEVFEGKVDAQYILKDLKNFHELYVLHLIACI